MTPALAVKIFTVDGFPLRLDSMFLYIFYFPFVFYAGRYCECDNFSWQPWGEDETHFPQTYCTNILAEY